MSIEGWLNRNIAPLITALGITRRSVTLEVKGRKSGKPIKLSISPAELDGVRYLVSLYGEPAWVKNVRAANGEAYVIHGGRRPVLLREVPVEERAPILLAFLESRAFTRSPKRASRLYFGTDRPTLEHMEKRAPEFAVFAIEPRDLSV